MEMTVERHVTWSRGDGDLHVDWKTRVPCKGGNICAQESYERDEVSPRVALWAISIVAAFVCQGERLV